MGPITDPDTIRETVEKWIEAKAAEDPDIMAGPWTAPLLPFVRLESILPTALPHHPHARLIFSYTVQPTHCNRLGSLHGGAGATLFDMCTTMPLVPLGTRPGFWQLLGVSRTLNVTYLRPAMSGMKVLIECEAVQVGKRMCMLRGVMRSADGDDGTGLGGDVIAVCEHNKVNIDPQEKL